MHVAPAKWTKHHAHRIGHLSIFILTLVCFLFVNFEFAFSYFTAKGDVLTESVAVGAHVSEIQERPEVIIPRLSGDAFKQPPVNSVGNSRVTIEPNLNLGSYKDNHFVFNTQYPAFLGTTSIPYARIEITLRSMPVIQGITFADSDGNWEWASSEPISTGQHSVDILSMDMGNSNSFGAGSLGFIVEIPSGNRIILPAAPLQDSVSNIKVELFVDPQYKFVRPGGELKVTIKVSNLDSKNSQDVTFKYLILNKDKKIIFEKIETVNVVSSTTIFKIFHISEFIKSGDYDVVVSIPSSKQILTASDSFTVEGAPLLTSVNSVPLDLSKLYQIFWAIIFILLLIIIYEYNRIQVLSWRIRDLNRASHLRFS